MGRRHRLQLLSGTFSLAFSPPSTFCCRFGTFLRHCLLMLTLPFSLRPRFGLPPPPPDNLPLLALPVRRPADPSLPLSRRRFSVSVEPSLLSWYRSGLRGT